MANKREKASDYRAGKRKDRNQRAGKRIPELGYYLIITDTKETEKNYFEGLRNTIPKELKDHLVIKVEKAKTTELVERARELIDTESQYRIPWIVFDRDQVNDFDKIIQAAEKRDINAGWSNPCFEIWMYAYFGEMPVIRESYTCCNRFTEKFEKATKQRYLKNDKDIYLSNRRLSRAISADYFRRKHLSQSAVNEAKAHYIGCHRRLSRAYFSSA
ncbi:MAG: RloB family protein, partial [Lachnospiraceae bacterium]|nr:RloB family protein [Lachnospiraceae bacterium]